MYTTTTMAKLKNKKNVSVMDRTEAADSKAYGQ